MLILPINPIDVKLLCTIDAKFDKNLWDPLPYETDRHMKRLNFSIIMKVTAGSLTWTISCEGQESGERSVNVVYE